MIHSTVAKEIMVTRLVTLSPDMDVFDAVGILVKKKISGAPVVDEHHNLLGVFSEKNCMSALIDAVYDSLPNTEVRAFMTTDPITITEQTGLLSIAQIFLTTQARRLPVLRGTRLVGQISRRDVVQVALKLMSPAQPHESSILYLSALKERDEAPMQ